MIMIEKFHRAFAIACAFAIATPAVVAAQPEAAAADTVPIATVLGSVAKRTGKKFIVDPRVSGDVLLLQDNAATLSYDHLLTVLQVHGFAAVSDGDYVRVVPEESVRQMAIPLADGNKYAPAEYVTRVIAVKSVPAAHLVPTLRPLIPKQGHMVALPCTNDLVIVDTFGNVQRLEKLIRSLDHGQPFKPVDCSVGEFASKPAQTDKSGKN